MKIVYSPVLSATDVTTCESCWRAQVQAARLSDNGGRDLLCHSCAESDYPIRTELFPPFGIYRLTHRKVKSRG